MKINSTPFSTFANPYKQQFSLAQTAEDSKSAVKKEVQKSIAQLQSASSETGDNNPKVQEIMAKFKSGKKLSLAEMNYLRKHAPGLVAKVEQAHMERAMYEQGMRAAPTKLGVQLVVMNASQQISNYKNQEDIEIRSMHLQDAVAEYTATEEYKQKPDAVLDDDKHKKKQKTKQHDDDNDTGKLYANAYRAELNAAQAQHISSNISITE